MSNLAKGLSKKKDSSTNYRDKISAQISNMNYQHKLRTQVSCTNQQEEISGTGKQHKLAA
jgi:hypothetical protein